MLLIRRVFSSKNSILALCLFFLISFNSIILAQYTKQYKLIDGHKIYYITAGKGKDTVVLIHGLFAQKEQWIGLMSALADNGYLVVVPDMPGYGESNSFPLSCYPINIQVKLLNELLASLNIYKFNIAGNSLGGAIAISYAETYPKQVESIALIGGALGISRWDKSLMEDFSKGFNPFIPLDKKEFNEEMRLLFSSKINISNDQIDDVVKEYKENYQKDSAIFNIVSMSSYNLLFNIKENKIKKVLVLWGKDDRVFETPTNSMVKKIFPNAEYILLDKSGHLPMLENLKDVEKIYLNFLKPDKKP